VQELLNIEQFGQTKFNKIKTKYFREFLEAQKYKVKDLFPGKVQGSSIACKIGTIIVPITSFALNICRHLYLSINQELHLKWNQTNL
jgi:hypothetical protein